MSQHRALLGARPCPTSRHLTTNPTEDRNAYSRSSLDDDDLSSHEVSDHADEDDPSFQFAIAPQAQAQQRQQTELTRIPLTHMNLADHILDNTFGDSLQSLSESLSELDVENEEGMLRIIEERRGDPWRHDDAQTPGRRQRRKRVLFGCCSVIGIILVSLVVGRKSMQARDHHTAEDISRDPLKDDTDDTDASWENACSPHSISTKAGRHRCADACRIYDCCAADDGDELTDKNCSDDKVEDCQRFWRLCPDVLDLQVDPPATQPDRASNWQQQQVVMACGEANTNTQKFDECTQLCENHLCCLALYGGGCASIKDYQCHVYREPCSVLAVDLAQAIVQHVGKEHEAKAEAGGGRRP